jgi:hypothetical protein
MKTPNLMTGGARRSGRIFRTTLLGCATLLGVQCAWLILPQLFRPGHDELPVNPTAAGAVAKDWEGALWAASVGGIRGDLWAEAAFTQTSLLWDDKNYTKEEVIASFDRAKMSVLRALRDAPYRSDAWLFLAGLASRFPGQGLNPVDCLKMAYYTGLSDLPRVLLRLRIAMQSGAFQDEETRELVKRDIRLLVTDHRIRDLGEVFNATSSNARIFLEQAIRDVDPAALDQLVGASGKPQLIPH